MTVIMQLGALQSEAAQRGDDRAAVTLQDAAELLINDAVTATALAMRRASEAERQQRKRDKRHGTSRDVTVRPVTAPQVSPDPFLTPEEEARSNARDLYAESVENLTSLLHSRVGDELWPDCDGFIRRREYLKWAPWIKEMLACITGGQATAADLAQVCRDDAALAREIGSPKGLRVFVASAARERLNPSGGAAAQQRRGGVAQRTFDNGRRALDGLP